MSFTAPDINGRCMFDIGGRMVDRVTAFKRYPATLDAGWGTAAVTRGYVFPSTTSRGPVRRAPAGNTVIVAYPLETITAAPNYRAVTGDMLSADGGSEVLTHYRGVTQLA
jgi:hypothetical protein